VNCSRASVDECQPAPLVPTGRCTGNDNRRAARRLIGCLPVAREQSRVEPLQVGRRQAPQKLPGELKRFLDAPALTALFDELVLEVVSRLPTGSYVTEMRSSPYGGLAFLTRSWSLETP
jgi:hypothetical protein